MAKKHLFSLNAPKNWPIERKKQIWLTRPNPGPHPLNRCLPLSILLRNVLKYARTMREVKTILNEGGILIDSKIRKDYKFPVGLMDVIEVKKTNEFFRLILDENNKYSLIKLNKDNSDLKPYKIINKKILKKGKIQINLFDGKNLLVDKNDYKVGDTLIINIKDNKIVNHLKLSKGAIVYILDGQYTGSHGTLDDVSIQKGLQRNKIVFTKGKDRIETLRDYAFVIPEDLIK